MRVLSLIHHPDETLGSIGDFLAGQKAEVHEALLYEGQALPQSPEGIDAMVLMGGPMSVNDEAIHPWLGPENEFLKAALAADVPMLGICLGSQLIAKALGAVVKPNRVKEEGWFELSLTEAGLGDPLFAGVDPVFPVFQWHGDTFGLPAGAEHLAASQLCAHQAFRRGAAYGLQFHVEVTERIVEVWAAEDPRIDKILNGFKGPGLQMARQAQRIYANFWDQAEARRLEKEASS